MANFDSNKSVAGVSPKAALGVNVAMAEWDTDDLSALVSGDILEGVKIPAGATIIDGYTQCDVAMSDDGSPSCSFDIGDSTDADGLMDGADVNVAGMDRFGFGTNGYKLLGKTYTSDDQIDITITSLQGAPVAGGTLKLVVLYTMDA